MPRGRMLNKKISYDEKIAQLSLKSKLLFTWMIPFLDVKGRILVNSAVIKGQIVPFVKEITLKNIPILLKEMQDLKLIAIYGDKQQYAQFVGFTKNQTLQEGRESPSYLPDPTPAELQQNSSRTPIEVNISKVNISEVKKLHFDFVLLTEKEKQDLVGKFGEAGAKDRIENLNCYLGSKGDKYKSHYHTILNWDRREKKAIPQTRPEGASGRELK